MLTYTTPSRSNAHRQRSSTAEVRWQDCYARHKQASHPQPHANTLCKYELPVGMAKTCHHHAKDSEKAPNAEKSAEEANVEYWTNDTGSCNEDEDLERADP